MEQFDQIASIIALSMGAAWACGINLYAAMFMLGFMGSTGNIDLPPGLEILSDPLVLVAAGVMYCIEFFADKIPGVDSSWDLMHTFVRVPAGAMMAMGAVGEMEPAVGLAAGILGGGLAAATHVTKAGSRALINTSPEPFSNWTASVMEDVAVIAGLWTALKHPVLFIVLLVLFILLMIWLLPKMWRGIKAVFRKIRNIFGGRKDPSPPDSPDGAQIQAPVRTGTTEPPDK